jgi:hypothetical protein
LLKRPHECHHGGGTLTGAQGSGKEPALATAAPATAVEFATKERRVTFDVMPNPTS